MPRTHSLQDTRNVGIMAHIDAGKTTTTERILFYSGKTHKIGEVHEGAATMDWMVQEQERGITITSACTTTSWKGKKVNIIDTPGHVDFTVEVERSLKVLDGAVTVLCARSGAQPQTTKVWNQANKYKVPRMIYVNKMDTNDANFFHAMETVEKNLKARPVPIQIPIGEADTFKGLIDLLEMKSYIYNDDLGIDVTVGEIPAELKAKAEEYRAKMIEAAAEQDDQLLEKFFETGELTTEEIKRGLRLGTLNLKIFPAVCGSSYKNKGVPKLLDAIVDYLPCPTDIPAIKGENPETNKEEERESSDSAPFSGLAFKVMTDPFVGQLVFFRVYSGTLQAGSYVYNCTKGVKERVGRLIQMHSNNRNEITDVCAGDIAAIVGLKSTVTGDTLCDDKHPIILEPMVFDEPVIKIAIEPKTKAMQEKMVMALVKLAGEDPTFKTFTDQETGQTIIAGMGELHLDIMIDRLKREFNVEVTKGKPMVSYKEAITTNSRAEGKYIKQSGGKGQYGHCVIEMSPLQPGEGFIFEDKTVGGSIPREYIPAVEKGLKEAKNSGVLAGYEMVDFKVAVVDGSYHDVDSSEMAFKIAASMAYREACLKANPILLEPITKVQVEVPEEYLGNVIGDLSTRRGALQGMEAQSGVQVINAEVPLSEMFGYITDLRSNTQGKGTFSMVVDKYQEVPKFVADKIISERAKKN